ncbi:unnamed protein product, partial [Ectocarpus sp. 12 AP-2014]
RQVSVREESRVASESSMGPRASKTRQTLAISTDSGLTSSTAGILSKYPSGKMSAFQPWRRPLQASTRLSSRTGRQAAEKLSA